MSDDKKAPAPQSDVERLADALIARQPADPMNMGLSAEKRRELTASAKPQRYRMIKCIDEDTKVRFVATVVESKVGPHGRITRIDGFQWPEGIYQHVKRGGIVPDGMPIFGGGGSSPDMAWQPGMEVISTTLNHLYKKWVLETFVQPVFKRYPGREFRAEWCDPEGEGLKTPWQMSGVEIVEPAAAE